MSKANQVEAAFKECGIGGRFSKFLWERDGTRAKMINRDNPKLNRWNYRLLEQFNIGGCVEVNSVTADLVVQQDPVLKSHFSTAQKVIARLVKGIDNRNRMDDNRYYIDRKAGSMFLVNNGYSIGIIPAVN